MYSLLDGRNDGVRDETSSLLRWSGRHALAYHSHRIALLIALFALHTSIVPSTAYRTNTAYQRWDEARKNWGMNINHTRDLVRMGNAYYDRTAATEEERQEDLKRLSLCTWAFVRSMKRHLSPESEDEAEFKAELYEKLPKSQAEKIIKAAHRPNRALYDLSMAIENLPMHFLRKNEMHAALTIFEDNLGSSERLLTSPVPLFYNRHTARFLSVWLLLVPFALWEPFGFMWNHIGMLPTMAVVTLLLFGIEELATQMEEPFTILPMQAFCDKIGNWCNEIVSWKDGDNGVESNQSFQGFVDGVQVPQQSSAFY
jgi:ion channel-forming bestrophin family protein